MSSDVKMTLTPCVGKVRRLEGRGQGQADLTEAKPRWNAEARNSPPLESKELWTLPCLQDMASCPGVGEAVDTGTEARGVQFLGALILAHTCPLEIAGPPRFRRKGVGLGSQHLGLSFHPVPPWALHTHLLCPRFGAPQGCPSFAD